VYISSWFLVKFFSMSEILLSSDLFYFIYRGLEKWILLLREATTS